MTEVIDAQGRWILKPCRFCGADSKVMHPAGVVSGRWTCTRCGGKQAEAPPHKTDARGGTAVTNTAPTMWQRTLRSFLGDQVVLKLRGGLYLEGELKDPGPVDVTLVLPTGTTKIVEYADILGVKVK